MSPAAANWGENGAERFDRFTTTGAGAAPRPSLDPRRANELRRAWSCMPIAARNARRPIVRREFRPSGRLRRVEDFLPVGGCSGIADNALQSFGRESIWLRALAIW